MRLTCYHCIIPRRIFLVYISKYVRVIYKGMYFCSSTYIRLTFSQIRHKIETFFIIKRGNAIRKYLHVTETGWKRVHEIQRIGTSFSCFEYTSDFCKSQERILLFLSSDGSKPFSYSMSSNSSVCSFNCDSDFNTIHDYQILRFYIHRYKTLTALASYL